MSVPKWRRDSHEKGTKKGWQDATTAAEKLFKHTLQKTGGPGGRTYFSKSDTFTRRIPLRRYYWYLFGRRAPEWNPKKRRYKMHEEIIFTSISDQESRETSIIGGWKLFPEETWTMQQKPQETTATPC